MRNEKGQFVKGHSIFDNNPFKIGNKIGPRFEKGYTPWNKDKKTGPQSKKWRSNISNSLKGRSTSESDRKKLRKPKLDGASRHWFGDYKEYKAIHYKIYKLFGKPDKCERCKKEGLSGRQIHWSNISGDYKLERSDWRRLCAKCHAYFDKTAEYIKCLK